MQGQQLSQQVRVTQGLGYFAAGTTKRTSAIIDMAGCEGVVFLIELGTIIEAGTLDAFVEQNTANATSGMARLAGQTALTVTAAQALLTQSVIAIDVYRPRERYLQCNITPAVQNAVVLGITALRYGVRIVPDPGAGVLVSTVLVSPAEA